jgi:glyoxylate carboligase
MSICWNRVLTGCPDRAIPCSKLGEIEKGKSLLGVIVEAANSSSPAIGLHSRQQVDHSVPHRRQHLRRRALADPAAVLPQRHVPDVVQLVLDPPVPAR